MQSFEVLLDLYIYCLVGQSVVVFCLCSVVKVLLSFFLYLSISVTFMSALRSIIEVSAVQERGLYVSVLVLFTSVLRSVMFSFLCFSNLVMFMSVLCSAIVVLLSFILYLSVLVMFMSTLCSVTFSFLYFSISSMFFKYLLCILI